MISQPEIFGLSMPVKRNYSELAKKYAQAAVADRKGKKYCKWVRLAARRFLNDLKRADRKRGWLYEFNDWHVTDVCSFVEKLPHIEGSWKTKTIFLEPAQVFWLANIFGWRKKSDNTRRFSNVYIEVGRKNAKSTFTAAVSLYCLTCEDEVGPQVIIGATTGEQAKKVFKPAQEMVKKDPQFRQAFKVEAWAKSIACYDNGGFIQTINAKSDTQDGWNPHVGILDELHAHKDRGLYDVIRSAFGSRKNPLMWIITTAGYNVQGVCYQQRTLVTKILEGVVDADHYFGVIYTLDDKDKDYDESTWIKANPLLGVAVSLDEMRKYSVEAKNSPDSHGEFVTKRLNRWLRAASGHIKIRKWMDCTAEYTLDQLVDYPCWGGLDLANVSDLCSLRFLWELPDGQYYTWGRSYLPEEVIEPRTSHGNTPYLRWKKEGLIIATPGEVTDYEYIYRDITWALESFRVQGIAFDPWNSTDIVNRLLNDEAPMMMFRQGHASFNPAIKKLDRLYMTNAIGGLGNPVLSWCASNVVMRLDQNGNYAPDKKKSEEKIDEYVALAMAVGLSISEEDAESIYNARGVQSV